MYKKKFFDDLLFFSKDVIDSDRFVELTAEAKVLYIYLNMFATRSGYVVNLVPAMRLAGADEHDLDLLFAYDFLAVNEYDDFFIADWNDNNKHHLQEPRSSREYNAFKKAVLQRDKHCIKCGTTEHLEVHHIKPYAKYPEYRTDVDNGITLCKECHKALHRWIRKKGIEF